MNHIDRIELIILEDSDVAQSLTSFCSSIVTNLKIPVKICKSFFVFRSTQRRNTKPYFEFRHI